MEYITKKELENAFLHEYRHYLTGHLQRPQKHLKHFEDDIEIGMSDYPEFTADQPHVHPTATEHGLILKGSVKIRCLQNDGSTTEEMKFDEGDFFLIRPGVPHASKNAPGTRVLFIKSPGINDKTVVEVDDDTKDWLKSW